ncbi:MAG: DUF7249 family protein [Aliihoeflea sp.]|uniref:DUF7249 family protein n=1 Tax=Aliihoeflea sp. TaxID=2608088 RepID=UPI004037BCA6
MTYNGWKNYETWSVSLQVQNDEGLINAMLKQREETDFTADSAEAFCRECFPSGTPEMDHSSEMDIVDWAAIAAAFNEN